MVSHVRLFFIGWLALAHALALAGLARLVFDERAVEAALRVLLSYQICGMGVTLGAHRLWTHQSFQAHAAVRIWLLLLYKSCFQGPLDWWCVTHKVHHHNMNKDVDPYNAKLGLWHAQVGWMFYAHTDVQKAAMKQVPRPSVRDPVVK